MGPVSGRTSDDSCPPPEDLRLTGEELFPSLTRPFLPWNSSGECRDGKCGRRRFRVIIQLCACVLPQLGRCSKYFQGIRWQSGRNGCGRHAEPSCHDFTIRDDRVALDLLLYSSPANDLIHSCKHHSSPVATSSPRKHLFPTPGRWNRSLRAIGLHRVSSHPRTQFLPPAGRS